MNPQMSAKQLAALYVKQNEGLASSMATRLKYFIYPDLLADTTLCYAYQDSGGLWTIGRGSITIPSGRKVKQGDYLTMKQVNDLFQLEFDERWDEILRNKTFSLSDNEMTALVDFAFNKGTPALLSSTLWKFLKNGTNKTIVAQQFSRWVYDNGNKVNGLVNRANSNIKIFLT